MNKILYSVIFVGIIFRKPMGKFQDPGELNQQDFMDFVSGHGFF